MDTTSENLGRILQSVANANLLPDEQRRAVAVGLASVLRKQDMGGSAAPGVAWVVDGEANALLVSSDRFVHARVSASTTAATSYRGTVDAVEATGLSAGGEGTWSVGTWHLTLTDGVVISLRAGDGDQARALEEFVHAHVLS